MKIDLNKYAEFVEGVTSDESKKSQALEDRMDKLRQVVHVPKMLTAAIGLASETGELNEIVKKCMFQGKPMDEDTKYHMARELGDIIWYWIQACESINYDPNKIIEMNVEKLKARYPGGEFDVHYSENRKEGDL